MLELLEEYRKNSLPEKGNFETGRGLALKADRQRNLLPFYGNTVIFELEEEARRALEVLREELYRKAGWMFSQRLGQETFHMTLHDLVNGKEPDEGLRAEMGEAERGAKALLEQWKDRPDLHMRATWMFNMVNTSVVLGLEPEDEESRIALEEMYIALEKVVPLNRKLTPHITLAYYCPNQYFQYEVGFLRQALRPVELKFRLKMKDLQFRNFTDMNHYTSDDIF